MAVNYFLKLDGVEGESVDANYKNQIHILSWNWGASQLSSVEANGGSGAGKVNLGEFSISTDFDKATPKFFKNICAGTHFKSATLTACKVTGSGSSKPYLTVDMGELFVTVIRLNAQTELPAVDLSFTYNDISIEYFKQSGDGTLVSTGAVSYDLKANKLEK
jgi:type VI secretion system secreted protein Hcp